MRLTLTVALLVAFAAVVPAIADDAALPTLTLVKSYNGHGGPALSVAFHPSDQQLAFGTQSGMLRVRDLTGGDADTNLTDAACWVAYSPFVVAANPNGTPLGIPSLVTLAPSSMLTIWYPDTFQRQGYYPDAGTNGALSANGRVMATTFGKMKIHIWPMEKWDPSWDRIKMATPDGIDGNVTAMGLNQNGSVMASGYLLADNSGVVVVWDRLTGKELNRFTLDQAPAQLVFPPKTKSCLIVTGRTADGLGLVRVLNERGDGVIATWPALPSPVLSAGFSWDEKHLATGRIDGTLDIWDVAQGKVVASVASAHQGPIRSIAWSHDSNTIATAGEDGYVHLWKAPR